ncbi:hypothetical protein KAS06_01140 [Candidatus Bathyarchaeota archaeon]|nr:hypothetical protein [Candidatus Bathyarchaeota archaeon]
MRGLPIFATFFAIFSVSTIAIPSPLFPGNLICHLFNISDVNQSSITSAVANGMFYGSIAWIIFSLSFRWIEDNPAKNKLTEKNK